MATIILPARTDQVRYTFGIDLDGASFGFAVYWVERSGAWFFDLSDVNGVVLLAGRRIVVGLPLLVRFADPRLPAGELCAIDTSNQNLDPGLGELGARVLLSYTEQADLPRA